MSKQDRRWSATTKRTVILVILALVALVLYRFRVVVPPLVIAFLLAFILDPIVDFLTGHLHFPRGLVTALVFLALIVGMLGVVAAPVPFFPQIGEAVEDLPETLTSIITTISDALDQPVNVLGYSLDLSPFYEDLNKMLRSFVSTVAEGTVDVAVGVASGAFWLVFVLMATFYLVKDADRLVEQLDRLPPAAYRDDFVRLRQRITEVWNAFLRGQLLLGLAMATLTTAVCVAVDLPYPIALGVLAGLMEFVPSIGPFIAAVPAVLLAGILGSSFLPLSKFWFAVLVAGLYVVIQQIEGNLLVPRILGRSLKLHPLLVLIAIVLGGSLAGILGMLLAAPVLATLRVVGRYVYCRLYDRDPFAEPEEKKSSKPALFKRAWGTFVSWLRKRRESRQRVREQEEAQRGQGQGDAGGADSPRPGWE